MSDPLLGAPEVDDRVVTLRGQFHALARRTCGMGSSLVAAARSAAPAIAGYLLARFIGAVVLWIWASVKHKNFLYLLSEKYDAAWYLGIVQHGYDQGQSLHSNLAFFPLFPFLVRAGTVVSPLADRATAVVLAWVFAISAAWGLHVLGSHLYNRRTGVLLAILWGVIPHAITESMAYSESLFTALAVWTLYAVVTRHWLTAGTLCLLAGLSRATASALIPVVCLAALLAIVRKCDGWRPYVAIVLAPAGWFGYLGWVALRIHDPRGWFIIQKRGWGSSWDGGRYTLTTIRHILTRTFPVDLYVVTLVLLLALMLFALCLIDRQTWPLLMFSALLLAASLGGAGYYNAKARFLVAAFPLLLPPAVALARARTSFAVVIITTLTLISALFGGYLLLVYGASP